MARISLRGYNRDIENHIDRGFINEAIAHCKHILRSFPKYLETYRLLGKAFLENQQYTDAADIFQRVLSVIPDDFVAHIGLSIIREDESNLNASIWHIERAFEVQPSNTAVQDELRRLYGKRDGIIPPKIQLTRGALIRMYLQGELFAQAIEEAKLALIDDPDRLDLEVILAKSQYLSGQRLEAAETCSRLIKKLPYCYEANKILTIILSESGKYADAKRFQKRIFEIEPYSKHISNKFPSFEFVPDNVILVEKLDYKASDYDAFQPDWAKSIGITIDETSDEVQKIDESQISDEEISSEIKAETLEDDSQDLLESISAELGSDSEDMIPEWMKEAGWSFPDEKEKQSEPDNLSLDSTSIKTTDQLNRFDFDPPKEIEIPQEELDQVELGDIPDWLQDFAPEGLEEDSSAAEISDKDDDIDDDLDIDIDGILEEAKQFDSEDSLDDKEPSDLLSIEKEETQPVEEEDSSGWLDSIEEEFLSDNVEFKESLVLGGEDDLGDLDWLSKLKSSDEETSLDEVEKENNSESDQFSELFKEGESLEAELPENDLGTEDDTSFFIPDQPVDESDLESKLSVIEQELNDDLNIQDNIQQLENLQIQYEHNIRVLELLGDAYFKVNQIQKALDCYSKAENLIEE